MTFDAEKVTIGTETEPPLNVTFTAHPPVNIKKLSFDISGSLKIDHNDNHYSLHVLGNINVTFASDNSLGFTDAA
ncbi:MAG: hypothetical protein QMO91_03020 [Candidatus Tisiphia sp.]|nr:hypothetical protein [Candidatus Tisiphia sp.]